MGWNCMKYVKRRIDLGEGEEVVYLFASPWESLNDVFAVEVKENGSAIRESMTEVLDYECDTAFFNGNIYEFTVYRDVTIIDRVAQAEVGALAEVDTQRLYRLIGQFLDDNGMAWERSDWDNEDWA